MTLSMSKNYYGFSFSDKFENEVSKLPYSKRGEVKKEVRNKVKEAGLNLNKKYSRKSEAEKYLVKLNKIQNCFTVSEMFDFLF